MSAAAPNKGVYSVCDTLDEAKEYALAKGISRVDHIGEEIEIIEL